MRAEAAFTLPENEEAFAGALVSGRPTNLSAVCRQRTLDLSCDAPDRLRMIEIPATGIGKSSRGESLSHLRNQA